MKKVTLKSIDELIAQAPELRLSQSPVPPHVFKEKMEKGEQILKIAGVPNRFKK